MLEWWRHLVLSPSGLFGGVRGSVDVRILEVRGVGVVENYARQKSQSFARFKLDFGDLPKIKNGQFTIYDFVTNSFLFSPSKKQLSIKLLEAVSEAPRTFPELVKLLHTPKSTLYFLCLSLERSGLIKKTPAKQYALSNEAAGVLREYAGWWENWVARNRLK